MRRLSTTGAAGITLIILLIASVSIAIIATSLIADSNSSEDPQVDVDEVLNDVLTEITTYLQIPDAIGKYYEVNGTQKIEKIAIMIKPLITCTLDISDITIKLENNENIRILSYSNLSDKLYSYSLFQHPIWRNITDNNFGCLIIHDTDDSIFKENTIDDHTDMIYLIIPLPKDFLMSYKDTIKVNIFPSSGTVKTISLEAPLPMKQVVDFMWDI